MFILYTHFPSLKRKVINKDAEQMCCQKFSKLGEVYVATLKQTKTPTINNRVPWKEQFRIMILRAGATVVKNVVITVNMKIY
jgi:hypothetical protein